MNGDVHLHRNIGLLPTYLLFLFFLGGSINSEWRKYEVSLESVASLLSVVSVHVGGAADLIVF